MKNTFRSLWLLQFTVRASLFNVFLFCFWSHWKWTFCGALRLDLYGGRFTVSLTQYGFILEQNQWKFYYCINHFVVRCGFLTSPVLHCTWPLPYIHLLLLHAHTQRTMQQQVKFCYLKTIWIIAFKMPG